MFYSITFSPTGGTETVARLLSTAWERKAYIDLTDAKGEYEWMRFSQNDVCLIVVPVYGGRVPSLAVKRLAMMKAEGTPCVICVVFGNRAFDDALLELKNTVINRGFRPVAAVNAVARHSVFSEVAAQRPDSADREELIRFSAALKKAVEVSQTPVEVPGNNAYVPIALPPVEIMLDSQLCNVCMKCADHCPAHAICFENPSVVDRTLCISCMRCVHICPTGARSIHISHEEMGMLKKRKPNTLYL